MLATLPNLGVGLGFREQFRAELFRNRAQVDFLEVIADHYLEPDWDLRPLIRRILHVVLENERSGAAVATSAGKDCS